MKVIEGVEDLDEWIIQNVESETKVILLYFGAVWCGPCKQLKKRLEEPETQNMMPNLAIGYMDVDEESNEKIVKRYKVLSLPTQIFIKLEGNRVVEAGRVEGYDITRLKIEYDRYFMH
jgi:thioredoxin-like negative regulator of GroEL